MYSNTGVCVIDDDKRIKNTTDLEFAFSTWKVRIRKIFLVQLYYCLF